MNFHIVAIAYLSATYRLIEVDLCTCDMSMGSLVCIDLNSNSDPQCIVVVLAAEAGTAAVATAAASVAAGS